MHSLPAPEVVQCFMDTSFEPHVPAMCLRWDASVPGEADGAGIYRKTCVWWRTSPNASAFTSFAATPTLTRCVLWNQTCLNWSHLSRMR